MKYDIEEFRYFPILFKIRQKQRSLEVTYQRAARTSSLTRYIQVFVGMTFGTKIVKQN
jgi:hypothetical protein